MKTEKFNPEMAVGSAPVIANQFLNGDVRDKQEDHKIAEVL